MKKVLISVALLLISAAIGTPTALATDNNTSSANNNRSSECTSNSHPQGYSDGAQAVRVFHLNDGSTVTVTSTGAVIKQSRCDSPYRQGWVNPADICNINSAEALNGRLSTGSSNPHGSQGYSGCPSTTNPAPTPPAAPTQPTQTQRVLPATTASPTSTPSQQQKPAAQSTGTTSLPNTGLQGVAAIGAGATIFGTIAHYLFNRRYGQ